MAVARWTPTRDRDGFMAHQVAAMFRKVITHPSRASGIRATRMCPPTSMLFRAQALPS
jgi:hypothetical protein